MPRAKVVLYNPRAVFWTMPLALLAVGSALDRRRYDVVIVDGRLERDPLGRLLHECQDALLLGLSVLTGAPLEDALEITRAVQAARPALKIVWGGWHPSLFAEACVREAGVAAAVVGQGEDTLCELAERLQDSGDLRGCAGTVVRCGSEVVSNPPRPLRDLQAFAAHDFGLIPVERYFAAKGQRQLDYVASQGCRFRCTFCADPTVFKRGWTGLPPERIGAELKELWQRHRFSELAFQDETFFTQPARVEAICDELLARGVRCNWTATLRADQGFRMHETLYAKARAAGLQRVVVGVESGSQELLDWMKKDATVEQVLVTAERLARHGIGATFNFIVGFPDEPPESIEQSLALLKRLRTVSSRFETPVFYYRPYPGTPIADRALRAGAGFPQTLAEWAEFDFVGRRGPWVSEALYERVERLKFYARHAWGPTSAWRLPLRALARWRCARDAYGFPLEKRLVEWLRPGVALS